MDQKTRLLLALQQINNVQRLTRDNQWEKYLHSHLNTVECELQRQLSNLTQHDRRRFQESSGKLPDVAEEQRS